MPQIADNIPETLRAILEDRNFVEQESAAIRAIIENPLDANKRYEAGKMYERFGLLSPALHAYQQVLELKPTHRKADNRAQQLLKAGVSPEDLEGLYQLPAILKPRSQAEQPASQSTDNLVAIIRYGMIHDLGAIPLQPGSHDKRLSITRLNIDELQLRSRSFELILLALGGIVSIGMAVIWLVMIVLQQLQIVELNIRLTNWTGTMLAGAAAGLSALFAFFYLNRLVVVQSNGSIIETGTFLGRRAWKLKPGDYLLFELQGQPAMQNRHCNASVFSANHRETLLLCKSEMADRHAAFCFYVAAAAAVVLGVPLSIKGSVRIDNPFLRDALLNINPHMQPLNPGVTT